MILYNIFYSFNLNHAYRNQRRLFSGNLPVMFNSWPISACLEEHAILLKLVSDFTNLCPLVGINLDSFTVYCYYWI